MKPITGFLGLMLCLLFGAAGCRSPKSDPVPSVELKPTQVTVSCGRDLRFGYRVSRPEYLPLSWNVLQKEGGSIDAKGRYQAPDHPGEFTVIAEAANHPEHRGEARVRVVPRPDGTIQAPTRIEVGQRKLKAAVPSVEGTQYRWSIQGGKLHPPVNAPEIQFDAGKGPRLVLKCRVTNAAGDTLTSSLELTVHPKPRVRIQPNHAVLTVGSRIRFGYELEGGTREALRWEVLEPGQGTIDSEGNYTAPPSSGFYRVRVNLALPGATGDEATVRVVERPLGTIEGPTTVQAGISWVKACVAEQIGMTYKWRIRGGTILYGEKESCLTFSPGSGPEVELSCVISNAAGATLELVRTMKVEPTSIKPINSVK